jgi:hypothetical protein
VAEGPHPLDDPFPGGEVGAAEERAEEGDRPAVRTGQEAGHHGQLVRGAGHDLGVAGQDRTGLGEREDQHAGQHHRQVVQPVAQLGDHAEVASAAA